jgi:alkanesulfonate monooxygenase SsuD/methylene tetrahydromethanopterin reductase-like flavin-dependent oxidoreductase (luciferase family)
MVLGVGPGSSARDYEAVGVPFDERWPRLDEAIQALRGLLSEAAPRFNGTWYTSEPQLRPAPVQPDGPPIWIGSWGSAAGLRRVARLSDGWLASGYNTTPEAFGAARQRLADRTGQTDFPNAIATMWFYVGTDAVDGENVLGAMAEMLNRPRNDLRDQLPIGTPDHCASVLRRYAAAGAHRVFLWPVRDPARQLEAFADLVRPLVGAA